VAGAFRLELPHTVPSRNKPSPAFRATPMEWVCCREIKKEAPTCHVFSRKIPCFVQKNGKSAKNESVSPYFSSGAKTSLPDFLH
jgi:hypothetical protein